MATEMLMQAQPPQAKPITAGDLRAALRVRYAMPEWALFFEVASGTGGNAGRYADAVAMNMYPSRGLVIHGFEIKVSRSDWLHELKQPTKSEPVQQYCDFWWVVTPKGIVKTGELPATWGLIETRGARLQCEFQAPKLTPKALDRSFAAALIRRAGEIDEQQRRAVIAQEREDARERYEKEHAQKLERGLARYRELEKEVAEFEAASGLNIKSYGGARIGEAVKELFIGWQSLPGRLEAVESNLTKMLSSVAAARAELAAKDHARE